MDISISKEDFISNSRCDISDVERNGSGMGDLSVSLGDLEPSLDRMLAQDRDTEDRGFFD